LTYVYALVIIFTNTHTKHNTTTTQRSNV